MRSIKGKCDYHTAESKTLELNLNKPRARTQNAGKLFTVTSEHVNSFSFKTLSKTVQNTGKIRFLVQTYCILGYYLMQKVET